MKKVLYFAAVLSAFMTSCNSENEIIDSNPVKGKSTITATFAQPATRVQMDESDGTHTPLQWNAGDRLVVYNITSKTYGLYQTASSVQDGDAEAVFDFVAATGSYEIIPAEAHLAVYPYAKIGSTTFAFKYRSPQTYTANSFDPAAMPMVASNASGTAFNNFIAQAAVLRLKVSTTASDVTVCSIDIESASMALTGDAALDMTLGTYGEPTTNTGKKVTLNCTTPVAINSTAKDFNIVVPGQTYPSGDLTITVKTNKGDFAKTSKAAATFAAGKVYNLTISGTPAPTGPEYVEIGDKKWATMNLGATTVAGSLATCAGDYYQWGSVNTLYSSVSWSGTPLSPTFTWKSGKGSGFVEANKEYTETSMTNNILPAANDVVKQTLGGGWRMPTKADFEDLHKACTGSTSAITTNLPTPSSSTPAGGVYWLAADQTFLPEYTGVAGILYVDQTDTSKRVFFPAAGYVPNTSLNLGGERGFYWSSSLTDNWAKAYRLFFCNSDDYSNVNPSNNCSRYYGLSVRPVSE